eukprot:613105-Rhodomonas_salina.1
MAGSFKSGNQSPTIDFRRVSNPTTVVGITELHPVERSKLALLLKSRGHRKSSVRGLVTNSERFAKTSIKYPELSLP